MKPTSLIVLLAVLCACQKSTHPEETAAVPADTAATASAAPPVAEAAAPATPDYTDSLAGRWLLVNPETKPYTHYRFPGDNPNQNCLLLEKAGQGLVLRVFEDDQPAGTYRITEVERVYGGTISNVMEYKLYYEQPNGAEADLLFTPVRNHLNGLVQVAGLLEGQDPKHYPYFVRETQRPLYTVQLQDPANAD